MQQAISITFSEVLSRSPNVGLTGKDEPVTFTISGSSRSQEPSSWLSSPCKLNEMMTLN